MPSIPGMPSVPGGGSRREKADRLRAEMDAKKSGAQAATSSTGGKPGAKVAPKAGTGEKQNRASFHHVKEGETLESIAEQYGVEPGDIWRAPLNRQIRERYSDDPGRLEPGDGLYIPGEVEGTGPVGEGEYIVRRDECISSIAKKTGHFWEKIWDDPANADLQTARERPNVLLVGDRITIPELTSKYETGETEMRHRFVRKGEPSTLKMRFMEFNEPRANAPYKAYVDGEFVQEGTLDGDGRVEIPVDPMAREATFLITDEDGDTHECRVALRRIPPVTEVSGLQARLHNLGFPCRVGSTYGPILARAVSAFQQEYDLPVTGIPDETTQAKLVELHGC